AFGVRLAVRLPNRLDISRLAVGTQCERRSSLARRRSEGAFSSHPVEAPFANEVTQRLFLLRLRHLTSRWLLALRSRARGFSSGGCCASLEIELERIGLSAEINLSLALQAVALNREVVVNDNGALRRLDFSLRSDLVAIDLDVFERRFSARTKTGNASGVVVTILLKSGCCVLFSLDAFDRARPLTLELV